jgi:hypothetical protein
MGFAPLRSTHPTRCAPTLALGDMHRKGKVEKIERGRKLLA